MNILIDGRTAAHTGSKGRVDAWQLYRQGNTVTPRLNISKTADAVQTSTTVSFEHCPAITTAAHIASSQGDADTEGGLLNGGLKGEATFFKTGSSQLLIEDHEAVRAFDLCEPNRGNGPLMPLMQTGATKVGGMNQVANLLINDSDSTQADTLLKIRIEGDDSEQYEGYCAVSTENITEPEAMVLYPRPIGSDAIRLSVTEHEPVMVWLLETDKVPAYTQQDRADCPALGNAWSPYYPIPLSIESIMPKSTQENSPSIEITCVNAYPVRRSQKKETTEAFEPLPSGWLYLFMEGYLWRECKITTVSQGMTLYHFSEVNLWTQQGRHQREATTQGRMHTILIPQTIQGKPVSIGVAFSETQWPWARVLSAGGMHPADMRVLPHKKTAPSQGEGVSFTDASDKPRIQTIRAYPVVTLHEAHDSLYPKYEGPILLC